MKTARITQIESDIARISLDIKPLAEKSVGSALAAEENTRFDELVEQLNKARLDLTDAEKQANAAADALLVHKQYNDPTDRIQRGVNLDTATDPGQKGETYKSPGQMFIESDGLKRAREDGTGITRHNPTNVKGFFGPEAQKAVISSAVPGASYLFPQVLPGIYRANEAPLRMRDVLMNLSTTSDAITVMQENVFTNAAAEVAEATANNGAGLTGGVKPLSDITFTEATFPVRWIAHYVEITRQMLEDMAFMEGYINQRLLTGLQRREDNQFLNGTGVAPNLTGILQTAGIQALTTAGEFTASPVANVGAAPENLDRLRRGIRKIRWTALAEPTFIVLNPVDAEKIDTLTDTTKQYLIGGPLAPAQRRLWGLQVVESANIAANTALVGDGTMAAVVDRNQARIYTTDSHSDYFIRNIFVILAEERVALPIFRPSAFATVQLV